MMARALLVDAIHGGMPSFERELVDGMNSPLSRIESPHAES